MTSAATCSICTDKQSEANKDQAVSDHFDLSVCSGCRSFGLFQYFCTRSSRVCCWCSGLHTKGLERCGEVTELVRSKVAWCQRNHDDGSGAWRIGYDDNKIKIR